MQNLKDYETIMKLSTYLEDNAKNSYFNTTGGDKTKCLIDFNKKRDRDLYYDHLKGPHEGRFENLNKLATYISQNKYISSPDFKKYTNRKPFLEAEKKLNESTKNPNGINNPFQLGESQYKPDYEKTKRSLSLGIPNFNRMGHRQEPGNNKSFIIPDHYDPDLIQKGVEMQSNYRRRH